MRALGMVTHNLAGTGNLEPLGRGTVCLDLWHLYLLILYHFMQALAGLGDQNESANIFVRGVWLSGIATAAWQGWF